MTNVSIAGPSCSGKSSVIAELKRRGHIVLEESAMLVIEKLNAKFGIEGQLKWRIENQLEFQSLIFRLHRFKLSLIVGANPGRVIFTDRGLEEPAGYLNYFKISLPKCMEDIPGNLRSDRIFVLSELDHFDTRHHTGRTSKQQDARDKWESVLSEYQSRSIPMSYIRKADVSVRCDQIESLLLEQ